MNNTDKLQTVFVLFGLTLLLSSYIISNISYNTTSVNISSYENDDIINTLVEEPQEVETYHTYIPELKNHFDWSLPQFEDWNCVNKSSVAYDYLVEEGYDVRLCRGYRNNADGTFDVGHSWVMVKIGDSWYDVESSGLIVDNTIYDWTNVYYTKESVKWY